MVELLLAGVGYATPVFQIGLYLLALAAGGQVGTERTVYSLGDAAAAYRDLRDGKVTGRAVIVP